MYNSQMNFLEFRKWFDERFSALLEQKVNDFSSNSENPDLNTIISYTTTVAQGGKRFRPFLVYNASEIDTKDIEKNFLLFASIELLHLFALIHDDIMDNGETRHGVVCVHKKFGSTYGEKTGISIAILLGDIVYAWAYECLLEYTKQFPEFRDRILEEYTRLVREVTYGQLLDVLSPVQSPLNQKQIVEKMTLKTARYSFVQPLRIGFILKGDSPDDQTFAEKLGLALGIGFQLQDDLLDTQTADKTGKSQFSDIQNGNQTLLSNFVLNSDKEFSDEFKTFFGKNLDEQKTEELSILLNKSGAIEYIEKLTQKYFDEARSLLQTENLEFNTKWSAVVDLVEKRKK